jgi:hypothetical protein
MSLDTQNTTWHSLPAESSVWTTCSGIKQTWSSSCMTCIQSMKRAIRLKLGLSIVRIGHSQKYDTTISGDLTPQCKNFYNFRNRGGNGRNWLKCMNLLYKQSTVSFFKAVDGGRVGQFLAVFVHLSCEAIFVNIFLRGRPKTPLIV